MKKIIISLALMLLTCMPVLAQDWQEAGFQQYTKIIKYHFPIVEYWMMSFPFEPEFIGDVQVGSRLMYTKTNCDERSLAVLRYIIYDLDRNIIANYEVSSEEKLNPSYQDLVEGSIGEQAWKSVCDGED